MTDDRLAEALNCDECLVHGYCYEGSLHPGILAAEVKRLRERCAGLEDEIAKLTAELIRQTRLATEAERRGKP